MLCWGPLIILPVAVIWLTPNDWPRWLFMWLLAAALFTSFKWLTWRRTPHTGVSRWLQAGYLFAWPGLDAAAFMRRSAPPPDRGEWLAALLKASLGAALFWGAACFIPPDRELLIGWFGMIGSILMLHFGSFHLLSCAWRSAGVDAQPLMKQPLRSRSLAEFWGKRWNTAFRDLTHRFVFRPLTVWCGPRGALIVGFLISGIIHDVVISIPAGGGYGGPTIYFALQGAGLLIERTLGFGRGWYGRLFTLVVLIGPLTLLFHPPFVHNVVLPFLRALGAF